MRRILFAFAAGVSAGYAAYRSVEAFNALRSDRQPLEKDPAAYGSLRRSLATAGMIRSLAGSAAIAAGGYGATLNRLTEWAPPLLRPPLLVCGALAIDALCELPASFVEEYEVERRYGLTEQTRRSWFSDHLKGTILAAAVFALLSIPFGALVRRRPHDWPMYATVMLAPVFVLAGLIVPVYVAPLFNNFTPLEGALEVRLRELASRFGVGGADILSIDMSKQTKKANAYVTGLFKTHRIVIGDTLLAAFPDGEIEFVVAHELGHYVKGDSWRMAGIAILSTGLTLGLANILVPRAVRTRYEDASSLYELYVWILCFSALLRPAVFAFSRSREWAADDFASRATHDGRTGVSAFRRLRDQNLAEDDVPSWYELLFSTHPSLGARIQRLESRG